MSALIIIGIIALVTIIIIISIYNGLIRRKNEVENAFGGIDVQLKKRYDLLPNLVAAVKEYVKHEQETLSKLTNLRSSALSGNLSMNDKIALDNEISGAIKNLIVAVENYPDLKANQNFIHLQKSLNEVEAQISAARRTFNAAVTDFNNGIQVFPNSIIAGMMNLEKKNVFEIPQTERENIDISKMF